MPSRNALVVGSGTVVKEIGPLVSFVGGGGVGKNWSRYCVFAVVEDSTTKFWDLNSVFVGEDVCKLNLVSKVAPVICPLLSATLNVRRSALVKLKMPIAAPLLL